MTVVSEELELLMRKAVSVMENPTLLSEEAALKLFDELGDVGRKEYGDKPQLEDCIRTLRTNMMLAVKNVN